MLKNLVNPPLEKEFQKFAIDFFRKLGFFIFRHNNVRIAKVGFVPLPKCELGLPDLIILFRGKAIGIECKMEGKNQDEDQKLREKDFKNNGHLYFVARNLDDLWMILSELKKLPPIQIQSII